MFQYGSISYGKRLDLKAVLSKEDWPRCTAVEQVGEDSASEP